MQRANSVAMRKALKVVNEYKKAGILFVAIPVLSEEDGHVLCAEAFKRLGLLTGKAEELEIKSGRGEQSGG